MMLMFAKLIVRLSSCFDFWRGWNSIKNSYEDKLISPKQLDNNFC